MKNLNLVLTTISCLAFSMTAFAETKPDTTAQAKTPKEACTMLTEAAKQGDFKTVQRLTSGMPQMAKMEKSFDKMSERNMERLKDMSCGTERVTQDHAVVEVETQGEKRLIPFRRETDSWKFDARTYMTFYRESMKEHGIKVPGSEKRS